MRDILDFLVSILRPLLWLAIPIELVAGGGGLMGLGLQHDMAILTWCGLALIAAGLVWGAVVYFLYS